MIWSLKSCGILTVLSFVVVVESGLNLKFLALLSTDIDIPPGGSLENSPLPSIEPKVTLPSPSLNLKSAIAYGKVPLSSDQPLVRPTKALVSKL